MLVLRTEHDIPADVRRKIALFCNVMPEAVVQSPDVPTIYEVPIVMHRQHFDEFILRKTGLPVEGQPHMQPWLDFLAKMHSADKDVNIALVGKYVELQDAYKSIDESLLQAATYNDRRLRLTDIHSERVDDRNVESLLKDFDGVIIAPGFGSRGVAGKLSAIKYCRENKVPVLGICLGMQCMVIEFARNVLGWDDADSTEMNHATYHNVIDLMEEQKNISNLGGTMRLGAYDCRLAPDSIPAKAYGKTDISERHRHRYEFNNDYRQEFEDAGMMCVGENPAAHLVEVVQVKDHPWMVGVQYHPEYSSTVLNPNPLFLDFIRAAIRHGESREA